MAQIDLIPESYRAYARAKHIVRHAGLISGTLLCVALTVLAYAQWQLNLENKRLVPLRQEAKEMAALQAQLAAMQEQKRELEEDSEALALLRGEGEAARAIQALDRALNEDVWLSRLRYKRVQASAASGASDVNNAQNGVLRVETGAAATDHQAAFYSQIEMHGAATGHAMLSQFMNVMAMQPEIAKVRFLNGSMGSTESTPTVQFSVDAVLRGGEAK